MVVCTDFRPFCYFLLSHNFMYVNVCMLGTTHSCLEPNSYMADGWSSDQLPSHLDELVSLPVVSAPVYIDALPSLNVVPLTTSDGILSLLSNENNRGGLSAAASSEYRLRATVCYSLSLQ